MHASGSVLWSWKVKCFNWHWLRTYYVLNSQLEACTQYLIWIDWL